MIKRKVCVKRLEFILNHLNNNIEVFINPNKFYAVVGSIRYDIEHSEFDKESIQSILIRLKQEFCNKGVHNEN